MPNKKAAVAPDQDGDHEIRLVLRLPADLHAQLTDMAHRELRSLNGQIIYLLRRVAETDTDKSS